MEVNVTDSTGTMTYDGYLTPSNLWQANLGNLVVQAKNIAPIDIPVTYLYRPFPYSSTDNFQQLVDGALPPGVATSCLPGWLQAPNTGFQIWQNELVIYSNWCHVNGETPTENVIWDCCDGPTTTPEINTSVGPLVNANFDSSTYLVVQNPLGFVATDFNIQFDGNFTFHTSTNIVIPMIDQGPTNVVGCYTCTAGGTFDIIAHSGGFSGVAAVACDSLTITSPIIQLSPNPQSYTINFQALTANINEPCTLTAGSKVAKFVLQGTLLDPVVHLTGNVTSFTAPASHSNISTGGMDPLKWVLFIGMVILLGCVAMGLLSCAAYILYAILIHVVLAPKKML
jgi:hypothetical protein